jgi:lysophospholipase L1-like esterase
MRSLTSGATGLAMAWGACVGLLWPTTTAAQTRVPTHIACVGDGITYGTGASTSAANYPSTLAQLFGPTTKVQDFGRPGATMQTTGDLPYEKQPVYATATSFVSSAGPTAVVDVIIMLGTNDSKAQNWTGDGGTSAMQYATDYAAMIDRFVGLSTHPIVYVALPPTAHSTAFGVNEGILETEIIPTIRQVAQQKGMPMIDVHTPTAAHPEYFGDGINPNDTGYKVIAQIMHDSLLGAGQAMPDAGAADSAAPDAPSEEAGTGSPDASAPSEGGPGLPDGGAASDEAGASGPAAPSNSDAAGAGGAPMPVTGATESSRGCGVGAHGSDGPARSLGFWFAFATLARIRARRVRGLTLL